jgi:hypothetical protein
MNANKKKGSQRLMIILISGKHRVQEISPLAVMLSGVIKCHSLEIWLNPEVEQ